MNFTSILDKEESSYRNRRRPEFFLDLNLDQLIERIQFQWAEDIAPLFYYFPENGECEKYRRDVFGDIKKDSIREILMDYVNLMRNRTKALHNKEEVELDIQKDVWHLWEVYHYCYAYEQLYEKLSQQNVESEGLKSFLSYLQDYLASDRFRTMKERAYELHKQLTSFQLVLTLENNQVTITQEQLTGTYEKFLNESFPGHNKQLRGPFAANLQLSNLEMELIQAFRKKNPTFFKAASQFYEEYFQYADKTLLRFHGEIGYYLAFYQFEENMKAEGFSFAVPTVDSSKEMQAMGLYDLALACVNYRQNKEVVSNDMVYHEGERFFVVTGPNQGGKTTFARSLGQLVYFTKMGLDVPALAANVHYFSDILSHFSVEESIETGRGKLKEELERLSPMMNSIFENAFVIINELFTTAANYDACIMGKRVLEHFLKQQCRGVYVTHLKELTEGDEQIVSLRALVEEVEENDKIRNVRKFKIIRSAAEDTGYASDLVEKYQLTYEQLKERMGGM